MLEKKMSNNYFQPKSYRTNKIGFNVIQVKKKKKKVLVIKDSKRITLNAYIFYKQFQFY